MTRLVSNIYTRGQATQQASPAQLARIEKMRKQVWDQQGVINVSLFELPQELRQLVADWAVKNYGVSSFVAKKNLFKQR